MNNVEIRPTCPYSKFNRKNGRSCTDDDLCSACWMDKDVEENREMYQALGEV